MQFSVAFVRSVYLAITLASAALAVPLLSSSKHATIQARTVAGGKIVESFHPESSFEVRTV